MWWSCTPCGRHGNTLPWCKILTHIMMRIVTWDDGVDQVGRRDRCAWVGGAIFSRLMWHSNMAWGYQGTCHIMGMAEVCMGLELGHASWGCLAEEMTLMSHNFVDENKSFGLDNVREVEDFFDSKLNFVNKSTINGRWLSMRRNT